ncbi:unnamed protein product [Zymoseptoria tritici ST99CH_3D7]|uniref:Uncharacterized protein n=1 Tax=Zymoseptoria tritici (strain ST99CH_3D7) TaxID=1276538 RepID=A0A1X7RXY9_ZYMT9|nr:unnamed protein product [Zymoseptoria tritici ST99CH_3D7]
MFVCLIRQSYTALMHFVSMLCRMQPAAQDLGFLISYKCISPRRQGVLPPSFRSKCKTPTKPIRLTSCGAFYTTA